MVRKRVVLVADQALGYFRTGGLGTATTFLALALGRTGHEVEILYFGDFPESPVDPEWQRLYEEADVRITPLTPVERPVEPPYFGRMRAVELALSADPADVVIAQDLGAPAYSALRLRRLGLAFENTLFVVYCHGSRQWITNMSRKVRVLPGALAVSRLERACVELADVVVSPSAYMVGWMREQGWRLPDATLVIPLVTRSAATGEPPPRPVASSNGTAVDRLAFFGRLEERKGVRPFVAGLNALAPELLEGVDLEFLGRATREFDRDRVEALLSESTTRALRSVSFKTDLDQHEALDRLSRPGTVAVIPSLEDNSPNVVYECLGRGIPFLASGVGGTSELIAPEDRSRVLFEPTVAGVADALQRALAEPGATRPARAAFDEGQSPQQWAEVVAMRPRAVAPPTLERPAVDAVVVGASSSAALASCVSAIHAQGYGELRAIAADTREAGLKAGDAPWIVFFDENDVPETGLVESLVRAQSSSGADVVTCGLFVGRSERFFSGQPGGLGVVGNDYGTVALVRRELLDQFGNPWPVVEDPDWPLLARLSAAGACIVSIPTPLVTRSASPGTLARFPTDGLLVVDQLERALPVHLRSLARLAAGLVAETQHSSTMSHAPLARRALRRLVKHVR